MDPSKAIGFAMVKGSDGKFTVYQNADQWSQTAMNASSMDKTKVSRWCKILDYLVSDEGYYFRGFGIPGKDWTMGSSGKPDVKWKVDSKTGVKVSPYDPNGTYPWSRAASALDNLSLESPAYPDWEKNLIESAYRNIENDSDIHFIKLDANLDYFQGKSYNKIGNDEAEIRAEIEKLMTSGDVKNDWNSWVQSKMSQIQPALDELNSGLK